MSASRAAGRVVSVNVNPKGGVPKHPVPSASVTTGGVSGDKQRDLRYHGGPDRAVSLFALERIDALRAEGNPIAPGTTGENLTVEGLDWPSLVPGVRLRVGPVVRLEVTGYANPCKHIAPSFADGDSARISQKRHPGWSRVYARVVAEGTVAEGDSVEVL
jgi:MOSC domain-containing protein YiiM